MDFAAIGNSMMLSKPTMRPYGHQPNEREYWWSLEKDYDDAARAEDRLRVLERITELNQKDYLAWSARGKTYFDIGKYEDAIKALEETLRIEPHHVDGWLSLGAAYRSLKDQEKSTSAYRNAVWYSEQDLEKYPEDAIALVMLGAAHAALGNRARVEVYKQLRAVSPSHAESFFENYVLP